MQMLARQRLAPIRLARYVAAVDQRVIQYVCQRQKQALVRSNNPPPVSIDHETERRKYACVIIIPYNIRVLIFSNNIPKKYDFDQI